MTVLYITEFCSYAVVYNHHGVDPYTGKRATRDSQEFQKVVEVVPGKGESGWREQRDYSVHPSSRLSPTMRLIADELERKAMRELK